MGGILSSSNPKAAPSEPIPVISFHSSAKWQLHFNSVQESSKLMVIVFSTTRCASCRIIEPSFNAMACKFADVDFIKIDAETLSEVSQKFGVEALPTFVLVRRGKVINRVVGTCTEELEKKIEDYRKERERERHKIEDLMTNLLGSESAEAAPSEHSPVISFQSSARWQQYFKSVQKSSSNLMVIEFSATWCGPCRLFEKSFNAIAGKFSDVEFVNIDIDELSEVAKIFEVEAMPTFVLVRRGKVLDKVVGTLEEELEKKIQKHRIK